MDDYKQSDASRQIAPAYCSEFAFLEPVLRPHGFSIVQPDNLLVGNLDHSIGFHRPAEISSWHLFDAQCVSTSNGRGFVRGNLFAHGGSSVATVAQQVVFSLPASAG
jgi:acyl-CoA thioesterase-2